MSILYFVKCEVCDKTVEGVTPPDSWYALSRGGETQHFHDEACLAIWRLTRLSMPAQQEPQDKPACKARRFLLVDEQANITECIKWANGRVTVEPPYDTGTYTYPSWDRFKKTNPGSGVQWIDQEVKEPLEEERTYEHPPMIGESESGW